MSTPCPSSQAQPSTTLSLDAYGKKGGNSYLRAACGGVGTSSLSRGIFFVRFCLGRLFPGPPRLLYSLGLCHKLVFPMFQEEINPLAKSVVSGAKWPGFTSAPGNLAADDLRHDLGVYYAITTSSVVQCEEHVVRTQ